MADIRIPIARTLDIDAFVGGTITEQSSYMQNAMVEKHQSDTGDRMTVTQRPAIDMIEDASANTVDATGRGIYRWDINNADYFINNDTIYKGGYTTTIGTISAGMNRCSFHEVGTRLVIVDPENNEVWTIVQATDVLAKVTDLDLPTSIAGRAVTLDGYLFLIDDDGIIYQSDLDDATSWNALNFLEAERENDDGVALAIHHDHVVAFGRGSIEFFYNAGNATGSVLSRRQDIFYNVGTPYEDGIWEDGDNIYFLGRTQRGDYGIYKISGFKMELISTPEINTFITGNYAQGGYFPLIAGFATRGHTFVCMTIHSVSTTLDPTYSFVYDITTGIWGLWDSAMAELTGIAGFPVIDWTLSSASRAGTGILTTGDIITLKGNFDPFDGFSARFYIEDESDYVVIDYIAPFGSIDTSNVELLCRFGHIDNNTVKNKFIDKAEIVADPTPSTQTLTLKWSDTDHSTWTSTRTIDLSERTIMSRLGKSNRRTYQIEYSGDEVVKLEALEVSIRQGSV